jgi:hypothetical protein
LAGRCVVPTIGLNLLCCLVVLGHELSQRAAALSYDLAMEGTFDELAKRLKAAYDLRSRLVHGSLTPAMAAKVTDRLWDIGDIVDVLQAWEASVTK